MRKVVEKTSHTYEEAVKAAAAELGIAPEQATIVLIRTRDLDRRRPGPEEYTVRAWVSEPAEATAAPEQDLSRVAASVCEHTAPTMAEAVRVCLDELGITEEQADIQVLRMQDTNPLKPGPEKITVRVWRRRAEPAEETR
ncbi:MAG TPA: hypothetical protein VGM37_04590 [Armatimonadota bacterium]|jgi:hypothetical protein